MAQNDNIGRLYGLLQKSGYSDIGTEDQFRAYVSDKNNARKLHGILQNEGYDDIGDENAFLGYLGVAQQNAVKPTVQQTQSVTPSKQPTQKTQMPVGFGQLDINSVNPIGGGLGWDAPKKEETPIERAVKGQLTLEETRRAQKRQRQKLDEAIYEQETGKRMRQPVHTASWEAPTLRRDENGNIQRDKNGNPLLGMTTDQNVVKAHQEIVANQEEWDSLSDREKREREKNVMLQVEQDNYEEPGFLGVTANKLGAGFIKAGLGLLNGMQALASGMIVEDASSPTGYSKTAEYNPADDSNAINRGLTTANEYAERMSRQGEPRKGEGFVDMLMDGDIGGFLLKGWGTGLESAPMTLSAYNPYTMVLNAVSMAGNNFREQTLENPDIPTWKRASMAVGSAAIEQAVEKYADPVFKYIGGGRILKKAGKEVGEEVTKKVTEEAEKTIANRIIDVLKDAAGEGLEEVATNFGNDALGEALDLLSGDKDYGIRAQWEELKRKNPNASLSDFAYQKAKENLDSFFGGALAGAYMSGGAQVTVSGLQYAVGKTVSGQQIVNNPKEQVHPVTLDVAQSFDEGYTLESEDERGSASARYYELDERLGDLVGEGVMQRIDRNPTEALANIDQFGLDEEGQKLLNDYIAAKATYDGMVERIQDDHRRSRVNSYNVRGNVVEELDSEGNVVGTHEYDNADDLKLGLFELQQERANNDMLADIKLMRAMRDGRLEQMLNEYCTMMDISIEDFEAILNKNPMERTEAEQQMVQPFSQALHETLYDNSSLHEEQNAEDGSDVADSMSIDLNEPDASQAEQITSAWNTAKKAREELFARNEDLTQEVIDREKQGMPHQGIISSLDSFSPQDVQVVIDYYNAQAKFEGFINRMSQNIDEEATNSRERHSFKGTVNGQADLSNVYTISDGVNEYFLVSGNVQTDADGKITGSDSGLVIGMDADGSFVQLSDTSGYSVMPSVQTLDQFEEQERIRLQEQVSSVIDPEGSLMENDVNDGFNGADGTNGSANTVGAEVAAEWLLSSGQNAISSTDYLLKALSGVFGKATSAIEAIRQKYAQQIASDTSLSEINDFVNSGMYNQIMSEVRDAINDAYSNNAEVQDIFDTIMQYPTGLPARLGQEVQKRLDSLSSSESTQLPLTEEQVAELMDAMESAAIPIPDLPLTPENWEAEFGEDGKVETPIGEVKMGENQIAKLFTNKRASEFGMIKPTLTNPQVVIEVPSNPVDHDVERNTSYLFIRAFVGKDGKKTYFFKSVTVSIDGMEVSVSSHYDRKKRVKEALEKGKLLYRFDGVAQTEQQPADVSVTTLPVTEQGGLSAGKDTENIDNVQENQQKISEVTDKDGVKRYENGVPVDVAIADIQADGLDVNETIDLAIGEAQQALDKIKTPKTRAEQVKNAQKRTELQNTIDYYTRMRDRFNESDGVNGLDVGNREETINNSVEQPASVENVVSSQASQTVEEKKQERIKELKAELGELFDDDFTKANDVYELVSMWVGRKRNLAWDDVNGKRGLQKELGWTRKIGGDTKYIETLLAKNGEGMGVDEFAHMVWESPENSVNGEKRWTDKEIKDALLELLQSAGSKSDVVDYAVNTRERQARAALEAERQRAEEEAMQESDITPLTSDEIAEMEDNLPFAQPTDEDIPDAPITLLSKEVEALMQEEGTPEVKLVDTDRMTDGDWIDLAMQMYEGAFISQEDLERAKEEIVSGGVWYNPENGVVTVYSDGQTPADIRYKVETIKDIINGRSNEREAEGLEAEVIQRPEEAANHGEETETPAAERTDEATGEGRTGEESVDPLEDIERNAALFREEQADNDTAGEPVYTDYKTVDGYTVRYSHEGEFPELAEGDFSLIEREFRENGYFGFSGGRVESADDVAYIFRNLEDSSIEHSFVVLVKDGEPRIIHLGMGNFSTTPVNMAAVRAAYDAFGADEIYFVHNHPSGSLKASKQDQGILEGIVGMFEGEDVEVQPGIIMNLKSGKYGVYGDEWSENPNRIEYRPTESVIGEKELVVHEFDKQVFKQGYDVTNLGKIDSPNAIAAFLTSHRLGAREKLSVLILNHQNEIVGNMALPYNGLNGDLKEIGKTIASVALRYGGVRVVPYGNFDLNGSAIRFLDKYVGKASGNSIHLTDAVSVENGYYKSAYDYGAMEPGSDLDSGYSEDLYAKDVNIVSAETEHGFKNFADAKKWAKDNIVRVYSNEETGGKGDINISGKAVEKFLSNDSVRKSENKDVHLSTLKVLPDIIREGVLAESHPDYKKVDGKRSKENGVNPGVTIHRVYGAVEIGDKTYRVKVTLKEDRTQAVKTRAYSYEATKIELLDGQSAAPVGTPRNSSNSISVANLLKGVEKSYGNGEKIIDSSQITDVDSGYSEDLTENEEKLNNKYKDENTHDLFLSLSEKEGEEYNGTVNEIAERVLSGRARIRREDTESGRRTRTKAQIGAEIISADRGGIPAANSVRAEFNEDAPSRTRIEDGIEQWAKANGLWIDENAVKESSHEKKLLGAGEESRVYLSEDGKTVTKFNDPYQRVNGGLLKALRNIDVFNTLFPVAPYRVVGYTRDADGKFRIVTEQPFVKGKQYDFEDYLRGGAEAKVVEMFDEMGMEPVEGDTTTYANEKYHVRDIHYGNVVEDNNGNMVVIDANPKYNEQYKKNVYGEDGFTLEDVDNGYSEELTATETPTESPYKQRIKDHINDVTEKLGSNNITNVIESIDDISDPERRAYIEQAHKEGRKVYGWFENGEVFLYLPDIDSEYKAEQTIWHETVAHVGLRGLVGDENYGKLLNRLWLEHKDKEMGEWITQRMQTNGWSLHKAIDEWLAREAEKVVAERQGRRTLWQKLAGWVGDMLRELGYRTNPTLTDVRYLFWLSENQLREGEPMSKIKQAAFLHRLEREIDGFNGLNRFNELDVVNEQYNRRLDELESDPNQRDRVLRLGRPGEFLREAGIADGEIVMDYDKFVRKSSERYKSRHPFTADDIKDLPKAINSPIAVFDSQSNGDKVILTELTKDGKNFIVAVRATSKPKKGGVTIEVNDITTLYPKNARGIVKWINDGSFTMVDKEKALRWIEALRPHVGTTISSEELVSAAKIIQETEKSKKSTDFNSLDAGYSEDIDNPLEQSAKDVYHDRLNRVETVFTEAYQDAMISLKTAQNAIAGDKNIPDSQNAYMAENLMHGKNKNEQDLFNRMFRDPIINTINKIMNITGMNWGDVDRYVYTKHGLERNRELYVRDWLEKERAKEGADLDLLNDIENRWLDAKSGFDTMLFSDYLESLDNFIRNNIDKEYNPSEHDYSGFRSMFGNEDGVYDETDIIADLMNTEDQMEADNVNELWERINAATKYGLERYRGAGMRSDEQIDRIEQMFHWYVPLRGFKEETGEDMYQYFSSKGNQKSYIGGLLKHAKGRGSEANYPISTIFAMSYKAISDCNQNLVNQKLYRLCQAHENDLIVLSDSWAVLNERTGEWEEAYPKLTDDMSEEEIRQATLAFEQEMKDLANDGKAKKLNGKQQFDYVPMDKKKKSEHVVEVRINGQQKRMTVVGNPRMAQALNGQLRFERGKNVFSKWNASIKNKMASLFTSYSPTFALRNMFRDWTHFRTMLSVREGERYAKAANKYYRQSLFKMVGMFKKYRNGTLDMSNEMERDFKDFMDNGGITGFVQMSKVDDIQKDMEKLYAQQKQGKPIRLNNKLWEKILDAVEALNEGIENNARFATYRASRHVGSRTRARSAYDAKEITVNFNRKGAGSKTYGFKSQNKRVEDAAKAFGVTSQVLGEGRIFFNATVQAIATTFKNFQHADGSLNKSYIAKWTAKYAIPPFMFGLALPMINKALASVFGGDDDDPYANLPEWTRRKNLCFYIGNNNFITIPIGQELAAFLSLGDMAAGMTYSPELKPLDKSFDDEIVGIMNTFSPVDVDTKITKGGLMENPISEVAGRTFSVLAPLVAVENNLSWTGRSIYREDRFQNDQYTPEYQMVYSGTNPVLVNASKLLHELGGGDDVTRGKLEVNPAIVQYLWEQYTGGPGKVFSNTISIGKDAQDLLSGSETEFNIRKVEGLKAFVQQGDDRTAYYRTQAKYRKYSEDAEKLYHDVKGYENGASENPMYLLKLEEITKGDDFVRMQIIRETDKQLSEINKAANKAEGRERKELRQLYNQSVKEVVDLLDDVGK